MSANDGPGGWDLTLARPWVAKPMDATNPHRAWMVVAPSKHGNGEVQIVTRLSEQDAKDIAKAGEK